MRAWLILLTAVASAAGACPANRFYDSDAEASAACEAEAATVGTSCFGVGGGSSMVYRYSSGKCLVAFYWVQCSEGQEPNPETGICEVPAACEANKSRGMQNVQFVSGITATTYCDGRCQITFNWTNDTNVWTYPPDTTQYGNLEVIENGETCTENDEPPADPGSGDSGGSSSSSIVCPAGYVAGADGICRQSGSGGSSSTPDTAGSSGSATGATCPAGYYRDGNTGQCVGTAGTAGCPQGYVQSGSNCISQATIGDGTATGGSTTGASNNCGGPGQVACRVDFCFSNPNSLLCTSSVVSGSPTDCSRPFNCTGGDAALCAQALTEREMLCGNDATVDNALAGNDPGNERIDPTNDTTVDVGSSLDMSEMFAASCPAPITAAVYGTTLTWDLAPFCTMAEVFGYLNVMLALMAAAYIIQGAANG